MHAHSDYLNKSDEENCWLQNKLNAGNSSNIDIRYIVGTSQLPSQVLSSTPRLRIKKGHMLTQRYLSSSREQAHNGHQLVLTLPSPEDWPTELREYAINRDGSIVGRLLNLHLLI